MFDNMEDLTKPKQERKSFNQLVELILTKVPQGKILLSSRKRIGLAGSIWGEEIFELSKLSPPACY